MADDDALLPEQERRVLELLEGLVVIDYANPERMGCPGAQFLRMLAHSRRDISLRDPRLDHVVHCSPCFREYAALRAAAASASVVGSETEGPR